MRKLWDTKLLILILCSSLVCIGYAFFLTPYVMPNFYNDDSPLSERLKSTSMGDSQGYGRYADSLLKQGAFQRADGIPVVKHMPGLPLILAITFGVSGSIDGFRVFQILFFFVSLYFFLVRIRERFPAIVLAATVAIMTFHPLMAQHFTAVMSDILFSSMLLWVAFVLYKPDPSNRDFLSAGLLLGLAVYLRESAFALVAAVGLAYLVKGPRIYLRPVGLMGCAFVVMLSPWVVRNYIQTREFIPLTTKATNLFYYYSIPLTTELYRPFGNGYDYEKIRRLYSENTPGSKPIRAGIQNYVSRPKEQLTSSLLKTIALFNKPGILRRPLSMTAKIGLTAFNLGFYIFHVGIILLGVLLAFSKQSSPFPYLAYIITAQYVQALLLWSESRYLMPVYPFVITIALTWYLQRGRSLLVRRRLTAFAAS